MSRFLVAWFFMPDSLSFSFFGFPGIYDDAVDTVSAGTHCSALNFLAFDLLVGFGDIESTPNIARSNGKHLKIIRPDEEGGIGAPGSVSDFSTLCCLGGRQARWKLHCRADKQQHEI
ncbi:hypothetical protein RRG08_024579 [Elysia crispata]|uniref:Uncharacterized protein n=1 Tax=Elysia crispata TaxID=231223 RepID=A0AAE0ZY76_9GAST|nr:hypothetical protein RRG08_024579 [Elysia crispata]